MLCGRTVRISGQSAEPRASFRVSFYLHRGKTSPISLIKIDIGFHPDFQGPPPGLFRFKRGKLETWGPLLSMTGSLFFLIVNTEVDL